MNKLACIPFYEFVLLPGYPVVVHALSHPLPTEVTKVSQNEFSDEQGEKAKEHRGYRHINKQMIGVS
jgi:hypothetical protein